MNKYLIFIACMLTSIVQSYAQCDYTTGQANVSVSSISSCSVISSLPSANQTVSARDQVTLGAGFSVNNTSGHVLSISTDHSIIPTQPLSYIGQFLSMGGYQTNIPDGPPIIDGSSRSLDKTNNIPGTIEGNVDIDVNGKSSFTFPILVSPGSNGMQPEIGVVYNSQSGNGIMGYGFHLYGLSIITRVSKSIYYDGLSGSPSLNPITVAQSDDALMLDGQRLIINSNYPNTYSPENDPYILVQFNSANNYFKVTDKDGNVSEFGNSATSKFTANGNVYSWGINKKIDPNGNYIEYIYKGDASTGEYNISTINYTGNANTKPYNSIYFYYSIRSDNNTSYIKSNPINETLLLTSIKVLTENQISKDYAFTYFYDDLYSKLNQISLNVDGNSYNPTIINWISDRLEKSYGKPMTDVTVTDAGTTMGQLKDNEVYFGDLNGDGITDLIKRNFNTITATINGKDYSTVINCISGVYEGKIIDITILDTDNDGKAEINIHINTTDGGLNEYDEIIQYKWDNQFNTKLYYINGYTFKADKEYYTYYYGDINNDGAIDLISVYHTTIKGITTGTINYIKGIGCTLNNVISNVDDIKLLDYDGDGQQEVMTITKNGIQNIYKYTGGTLVPIVPLNYSELGESRNTFVGDFNGDGLSDLLVYYNGIWYLKISLGKAVDYTVGGITYKKLFDSKVFPVLGLANYGPAQTGIEDVNSETNFFDNFDCNNKYTGSIPEHLIYKSSAVVIDDINSDGKSDIIYANGSNSNIIIFLSNGNSFFQSTLYGGTTNTLLHDPLTVEQNYENIVLYSVDINNDGKKEIVYGSKIQFHQRQIFQICYNTSNQHDYSAMGYNYPDVNYKIATFNDAINNYNDILSISNGNNIQSVFSYTAQQTNDIVTRSYPVVPTLTPLNLATHLKTTDLNTNTILSDKTYTFKNGFTHILDKGFLGFTTVTSSDVVSGLSSEKTFNITTPISTGIYYTYLKQEINKKNGIEISKDNERTLLYAGGDITKKLFYPYISSTKHTDEVTGYNTTNTILIPISNLYGRPTLITKSTSDGWFFKNEPSYSVVGTGTSIIWSENITQTLNNDIYNTLKSYPRTNTSTYLIDDIFINGIETRITKYDDYKNPINYFYKGITGMARTSTCAFDLYGRFKVLNTDVSGTTSYSSYRASDGAITSQTDINGLVTYYDYSSGGSGLVTKVNYPDGNSLTKTLTWDKSGSGALYTVETKQTNGNDVTEFYNANGQKIKETSIAYSGSSSLGNTITKTFTYNADGSLYEETAPGIDNIYGYNTDGTLKSKKNGTLLDLSYTYNKSPYKITITDNSNSVTKIQTFDAMGNITSVDGTLYGSKITFDYFASGKLKDRTGAGSEDDMTYDQVTLNQISETNSDSKKTTYGYNDFGQLKKQTDAMSQEINMTYYETSVDNSDYGRLKTKQVGTTGPIDTYKYYQTPGKLGLLQNIIRSDGSCSIVFDYDMFGRIITKTVTGKNDPNTSVVSTYTTTYTYNSAGQLASITYPSYTSSGHAGLTVKYNYDGTGNLQQITDASGNNIWHGVSQNDMGQWTKFTKEKNEAMITTMDYNPNNYSLANIKTGVASDPTFVQNLTYSFDNFGNLVNRTDGGYRNILSETLGYDHQNRLTSSQVTGASLYKYTYDDSKGGNIQTSTLSGTYNYTSNVHVPSSISDFSEEITGPSSPSIAAAYTFTADNKISTITNGINYTVTPSTSQLKDAFVYGIDGNRFRCDFSTSGTYQRSKVYVDNSEFGYFPVASKNFVRTIIYAPSGVVAVWQDSGTATPAFHYIHTDQLGSWLAITDGNGKVETNAIGNEYRYSYDAWGRPRDPKTWKLFQTNTGNIANALASISSYQPRFDHGYTGQEHIAGFGLINYNGRIYDPYLQMFVSPDPTVPHADNPLSYNRYSYCLNNPLRYIDPSGFKDMPTINIGGDVTCTYSTKTSFGTYFGSFYPYGFMAGYGTPQPLKPKITGTQLTQSRKQYNNNRLIASQAAVNSNRKVSNEVINNNAVWFNWCETSKKTSDQTVANMTSKVCVGFLLAPFVAEAAITTFSVAAAATPFVIEGTKTAFVASYIGLQTATPYVELTAYTAQTAVANSIGLSMGAGIANSIINHYFNAPAFLPNYGPIDNPIFNSASSLTDFGFYLFEK